MPDKIDGWDFKNFSPQEFICRCYEKCSHKNIDILDPRIPRIVQERRDELDIPITISSSLRCKNWNNSPAVGGSRNSFHVRGMAVDIAFEDIDPIIEAAHWVLDREHFGGVIAYPERGFVHLDFGPGGSRDGGRRYYVSVGGKIHRPDFEEARNAQAQENEKEKEDARTSA
ncbi:hypothetical protein [uncultured Mediterranean phage uvDeep-CGR2-AD3-C191]|nr:hypothetical protein [uncultured Mediterranean phage uvDeep-CGR2-AD3-C191]